MRVKSTYRSSAGHANTTGDAYNGRTVEKSRSRFLLEHLRSAANGKKMYVLLAYFAVH